MLFDKVNVRTPAAKSGWLWFCGSQLDSLDSRHDSWTAMAGTRLWTSFRCRFLRRFLIVYMVYRFLKDSVAWPCLTTHFESHILNLRNLRVQTSSLNRSLWPWERHVASVTASILSSSVRSWLERLMPGGPRANLRGILRIGGRAGFSIWHNLTVPQCSCLFLFVAWKIWQRTTPRLGLCRASFCCSAQGCAEPRRPAGSEWEQGLIADWSCRFSDGATFAILLPRDFVGGRGQRFPRTWPGSKNVTCCMFLSSLGARFALVFASRASARFDPRDSNSLLGRLALSLARSVFFFVL